MTKDARERTCFTVMPFGGWYDEYYKHIYKPAIAEAGLMPQRADDLSRTSTIINDIWGYTKDATIVLADLSDQNPNVFYELGLAHALAKPVVLVASSIDEVPFDLRALRVLVYDRNDPAWGDLLKKEIVKSIGELLVAPTKSVLPTFLAVEDMPDRPVVSKYEKELLELRSEFEVFRRQYEAGISFLSDNAVYSLSRRHKVLSVPAKRSRPHHTAEEERRFNRALEDMINSGFKKGASEASIIKRLLKYGATEDQAWELLHKCAGSSARPIEQSAADGLTSAVPSPPTAGGNTSSVHPTEGPHPLSADVKHQKKMANRQLTPDELKQANSLLAEIRQKLYALSGGVKDLLFALRRKVYKELTYDERSKPMVRRKLKDEKWKEQRGLCAFCGKELPTKYTVLDRLNAADGYTKENTRLIHQECDAAHQESKGYA